VQFRLIKTNVPGFTAAANFWFLISIFYLQAHFRLVHANAVIATGDPA